jgi:hypothetical protein
LEGFFSILLHVLVQIDAEEHPNQAEKIDFEFEAYRKFEQNHVDGEWADARVKMGREDRLNVAMRSHDSEDLPQDSSQYSTDENENDQHPV